MTPAGGDGSGAGAVVREHLGHARAGDWARAVEYFAQDIAIRIPGRSRFAGEHRGRAAAVGYIEAARALVHAGDVEVELVDVLESADRVALLVRERFERPEGAVEIRRANVYRVAGGEIAEVWIFEADQYAVDAMFGAAP